jgi:hypothetical protein
LDTDIGSGVGEHLVAIDENLSTEFFDTHLNIEEIVGFRRVNALILRLSAECPFARGSAYARRASRRRL